jgi:hypothetical protein
MPTYPDFQRLRVGHTGATGSTTTISLLTETVSP